MNVPLQDVPNASGPLSIKSYKVNTTERHCLPPPNETGKAGWSSRFFTRPAHTCALAESSVACTPKNFCQMQPPAVGEDE